MSNATDNTSNKPRGIKITIVDDTQLRIIFNREECRYAVAGLVGDPKLKYRGTIGDGLLLWFDNHGVSLRRTLSVDVPALEAYIILANIKAFPAKLPTFRPDYTLVMENGRPAFRLAPLPELALKASDSAKPFNPLLPPKRPPTVTSTVPAFRPDSAHFATFVTPPANKPNVTPPANKPKILAANPVANAPTPPPKPAAMPKPSLPVTPTPPSKAAPAFRATPEEIGVAASSVAKVLQRFRSGSAAMNQDDIRRIVTKHIGGTRQGMTEYVIGDTVKPTPTGTTTRPVPPWKSNAAQSTPTDAPRSPAPPATSPAPPSPTPAQASPAPQRPSTPAPSREVATTELKVPESVVNDLRSLIEMINNTMEGFDRIIVLRVEGNRLYATRKIISEEQL